MKIRDVYSFSYDYLVKLSDGIVTQQEIDDFINSTDIAKIKNLGDVFGMLLVMLQDFNMHPNVIRYHEREKDIKNEIGFPDIGKIATLDPEVLAQKFINKYNAKGTTAWKRYCKGIVSGAAFLNNFKDYKEFKKVCDSFDENDMTRESFALFLQTKIDNMGFAVACNWLKELGYRNYPKPDTHMKDICLALGLIDSKQNDMECFETMTKIARKCGVDPYKLDKVWWLICSGNYYRYKKQLPDPTKNKEVFIDSINNETIED